MESVRNSLNQTARRDYPAVDIIKFLCPLLVVTIHIAPFSSFSGAYAENWNHDIVLYLAQIAVPFYFSASGFFLFGKIDPQRVDYSVFKKFIFKNLRLWGLWSIALVVGLTGHLWFIKSLAFSAILLALLFRWKVSMKKMTILASVFYIIGLLGNTYSGLLVPLQGNDWFAKFMFVYKYLFPNARNGLFMGFPFVLLGGWVRKNSAKMTPIPALLGFLGSMLVFFQESRLLRRLEWPSAYSVYVFLPFVVYFLLSFATSVRMNSRPIYPKLRAVGVVVYFSHHLALFGFRAVFYLIRYFSGVDYSNSLSLCLLTLAASTAFGFALERLSRTEKFRFVRYLFS